MPVVKEYYFAKGVLIRREHFGCLILLRNGKRYLVDNAFFIFFQSNNTGQKIQIPKKFDLDFIKELERKNIITEKKINGGIPKIIANDFISEDCLTYPRTVYWECTNLCNYNCIHCYSSSGNKNNTAFLPFKIVKKMINEFAKLGVEFLSIGGGEPLLYPDIFRTIKYATSLGLTIEMTTNGSLLTAQAINKLKSSGLKFIQISLDGANPKTYNKIRINGNFNYVVDAINRAAKNFVLSVCTVINKLNKSEIIDMLKIAKLAGAEHYRIIPQMDAGRGENVKRFRLSKHELGIINELISKFRKTEKDMINVQFNENLLSPKEKNIFWMPENHYGCPAARTTCGIDARGNVYPCSYMVREELRCGNVKNKTLLEIWSKSKVMKYIRTVEKITGKCSKCKYLEICRGGCRAAAYLKNSKIDSSDPLCAI